MGLDTSIGGFVDQYGTYQGKVKKLALSLTRLFDLEYFLYTLVSNNGQIFAVGTDVRLLEFYFNTMLYKHDPILIEPSYISNKISYIHSSMIDSPLRGFVFPFMKDFNHDNILLFQECNRLGAHHYIFSNNKENGCIINQYLNNLDRIKLFISYFQHEMNSIIKNCTDSTPINLYDLPNEINLNIQTNLGYIIQKSRDLLCKNIDNVDIGTITSREWECLKLSIEGKSSKEIGLVLHISPRTVEFHIDNLKEKFKCSNKKELISKSAFIFHGSE